MRSAVILLMLSLSGAFAASESETNPSKKLYLTKCARCHKLHDPARYPDDAKWDAILEKMRNKARLTEEQFRLIQEYARSVRTSSSAQSQPEGR